MGCEGEVGCVRERWVVSGMCEGEGGECGM